ncbi:unnamed protein product, partial [Brassica oleracea var. botrytis]
SHIFFLTPCFLLFILPKRDFNVQDGIYCGCSDIYGSLIWNPGFDFDEKLIGYIKDYKRVFDLEIDHRGTPEHPARTCTLEQSTGAICRGAAYCVRGGPEKEKLAMEYLERRECEYDSKTLVEFYTETDTSEPILTGVIVYFCISLLLIFTSTPDKVSNKYYLGPAPLEEMAMQIATASGPRGNNWEYLFKLEKAMHDIGEFHNDFALNRKI